MASLRTRLAQLHEVAVSHRNTAYFDWLQRATTAQLRRTQPPMDIEVKALTEAQRKLYGKHLRSWLTHHGYKI